MSLRPIAIAAEGIVDLAVLRRLSSESGFEPYVEHGGRGKSYIDSRLPGFNNAAKFAPWLVARDLDQDAPCAGELVRTLLPSRARFMCFRIAVREIESWLLADATTLAASFRVPRRRIPDEPDDCSDPAFAMLTALQESEARSIREAMTRKRRDGSFERGPEYGTRLAEYAETAWKPANASKRSRSLRQAILRIEQLAETMKAQGAAPRG